MKDIDEMTDAEKLEVAEWFGEAKLYAALNLVANTEIRVANAPHVQKIADQLGITPLGVLSLIEPGAKHILKLAGDPPVEVNMLFNHTLWQMLLRLGDVDGHATSHHCNPQEVALRFLAQYDKLKEQQK